MGFGDAITPEAAEGEWQDLLDFPAARLLIYPPETVIAEKLEAAVSLGRNNSRMKDFFDLHWLSQYQSFNGTLLCDSVRPTFERRKTATPTDPPDALTSALSSDPGKVTQRDAFRRKGRLDAPEFPEIIARLSRFLTPLLSQEAGAKSGVPKPAEPKHPHEHEHQRIRRGYSSTVSAPENSWAQ